MVGFLAGLLAAAFFMGAILLAAGGITYVLGLVLSGLVVGATGRAAVPGSGPTGVGTTLLVAIGGSFLGGFAGWFVFGRSSQLLGFALSVAGAAFVVWLIERHEEGATA